MAITVTKDTVGAERISRNLGVLTGSIAFDSSYPTGGESSTDISGQFRTCLQVMIEPSGGYNFVWDKTNDKIMAYYPSNPAAHTHTITLSGTHAGNAVELTANSNAAALGEAGGTGYTGITGIQNATAADAVGAEVANATDISGVTAAKFVAIGLTGSLG
ncbi:hypothetical protein CMI37_01115 [Candidatus Pacearchaeota archaeon]|nr:hypothetical protein [Candidatus Pacearchaeota archaeon]|tara:strand:+ start:2796 stop:3275 length:480 start_codon:yes stop_codon:yes gene_type:complete